MKTKSIIFIDIFAPKWTRAQRKLTRFPSRDFCITPRIERINRKLKQQRWRRRRRRRRLQKRHLMSEFTNFIALIPSRLIHQMLANCLELNSKGLYQRSGKEKESCCLRFPSLTKPEIRHFHVVVVQ